MGDASVNHSTAAGALNTAAYCAYQRLPLPLLVVCEDNGHRHQRAHPARLGGRGRLGQAGPALLPRRRLRPGRRLRHHPGSGGVGQAAALPRVPAPVHGAAGRPCGRRPGDRLPAGRRDHRGSGRRPADRHRPAAHRRRPADPRRRARPVRGRARPGARPGGGTGRCPPADQRGPGDGAARAAPPGRGRGRCRRPGRGSGAAPRVRWPAARVGRADHPGPGHQRHAHRCPGGAAGACWCSARTSRARAACTG